MLLLSRVLVLLALACDAALAEPTPAPDASRAVTLGILREDALLVPFARFDGRSWHKLWGVEIEESESRPSGSETGWGTNTNGSSSSKWDAAGPAVSWR